MKKLGGVYMRACGPDAVVMPGTTQEFIDVPCQHGYHSDAGDHECLGECTCPCHQDELCQNTSAR